MGFPFYYFKSYDTSHKLTVSDKNEIFLSLIPSPWKGRRWHNNLSQGNEILNITCRAFCNLESNVVTFVN